jgi:hypothetical protein
MKLVYTHPHLIMVAQARTTLEQLDIRCVIHNEYAAGAIGELAPLDTWAELWVLHDRDEERAGIALSRLLSAVEPPDWTCKACDSVNPGTFDTCWHCAADQYLPA